MSLSEFHLRLAYNPALRICALRGYQDVACCAGIQAHHLIPKSALRGNPQALRYVEDAPFELLAPVCMVHNVGRYADEPLARALMIQQKVSEFGWGHMVAVLEGLQALMKVRRPEWGLDALLAPLEET